MVGLIGFRSGSGSGRGRLCCEFNCSVGSECIDIGSLDDGSKGFYFFHVVTERFQVGGGSIGIGLGLFVDQDGRPGGSVRGRLVCDCDSEDIVALGWVIGLTDLLLAFTALNLDHALAFGRGHIGGASKSSRDSGAGLRAFGVGEGVSQAEARGQFDCGGLVHELGAVALVLAVGGGRGGDAGPGRGLSEGGVIDCGVLELLARRSCALHRHRSAENISIGLGHDRGVAGHEANDVLIISGVLNGRQVSSVGGVSGGGGVIGGTGSRVGGDCGEDGPSVHSFDSNLLL